MKKAPGSRQPFFARFLENQLNKNAGHAIQAGTTLKHPSDHEDEGTKPAADVGYTDKYPSDNDEDNTKPAADIAHTDKYPSDNDEDNKY